MSGLWSATMSEAQAAVTPPADLDKYMVVVGPTSSGSTGLYGPFATARAIANAVGYGDATDIAGQVAEQRQTNGSDVPAIPVAVYKVPASTPGSYGTIVTSGVTGTCVPTVDSGTPYGTYRLAVRVEVGGTVGTAGIEYVEARDDGALGTPTWSVRKRLGTATSISVAQTGGGFVLAPANATVTALYTKLNTFAGVLSGTGHYVDTSGSPAIHASADTTNDTALAAVATATTHATAVTLFNACKTTLAAHGADATAHAGADATLATALAAIPTATTIADVDLHLPALIAAYTAHAANTTSVHGSADATNTITAYTAIPGTLVAGDTFFVYTYPPVPNAAAVDAAFAALSTSTKLFGIVALAYPQTAALLVRASLGLDACQAKNRRMVALAYTRLPDFENSEAEQDWYDAISAEYPVGTVDDSRVSLLAAYCHTTIARDVNTYRRAGFAQFCADVARVPISDPPCAPVDQPATGVSVWESDVQVGHDESFRGDVTGLSNADIGNRFICHMNSEDPLLGDAVYYTYPWTLAGASDQIKSLPMRRIATSMERVAVSAATGAGGAQLDYYTDEVGTKRLKDVSRNALHAVIFGALSERFKPYIQNADDADVETGLVWINPVITVATGQRVSVQYEIRVRYRGVLISFAGTFVVKE